MGLLKSNPLRFKLYLAIWLLIASIFIGTAGYMVVEGWTFMESLFMTVITLSTVGFNEVKPLSDAGRLFSVFLIIGNLGIFTYTITVLTRLLVDGELRDEYLRFQTKKKIRKLKNHTIVCGLGRNGRQACMELHGHGESFVVIEKNDIDSSLFNFPIMHIKGDARQDHVLQEAGIEHAKALITTLPDDAANVFVVITARHMKNELTIISRAGNDTSEDKLRRAGANNVIMPDKVGGAHMAYLVTKPDVVEFVDLITGQRGNEFQIAELSIDLINPKFVNQTISELDIRSKTGANIIGFKMSNGDYVINPQADQKMTEHSKLIVLGTKEQVRNLEAYYYS
ncbi:MAG: potassium channel protein [Bacteroidetes bacterium]|nr:potassium channel protein [Bacteroidota bacterium]